MTVEKCDSNLALEECQYVLISSVAAAKMFLSESAAAIIFTVFVCFSSKLEELQGGFFNYLTLGFSWTKSGVGISESISLLLLDIIFDKYVLR